MRIDGEWRVCDDGITRPTIQAKVQAANGAFHVEFFLVDSGADRGTVLSRHFIAQTLDCRKTSALLVSLCKRDLGGTSTVLLVNNVLEFSRDDGGAARVSGEFAAFTDPTATDLRMSLAVTYSTIST